MLLFPEGSQSGFAGIMSVIVLALLSIVGAGMVTSTSTEVSMAASYRDGVAAQYLAEAGIRWGYQYLDAQLVNTATKENIIAATNSSSGKTIINMDHGNIPFGSGATKGTVSVTVKLNPKDTTSTKRVILAVASVGLAKRQVVLPVILPADFTSLTAERWTSN